MRQGVVRSFSILVVDDFEGFRLFVCSLLRGRAEAQVTEASNGLEAVQKAEELQPDLILLDIGLPDLNGLEVARRVRIVAPTARILFLSQESSPDVVREALSRGASGYVHKPRCQTDLLPAIEAVLRGKQFVGSGLELGTDAPPRRHQILFCSDDEALLDGLTHFIGAALNAGDPAIVWATDSHRVSILQRLRAQGVDIDGAIQRGTYICADVAAAPDPTRMAEAFRALSAAASKAGRRHPRVAVCGERAGSMWAEGNADEAIRLEQLLNELGKHNDLHILCPYPLPQGEDDTSSLKSICAEHSAVSYR
jgi:DNA-binding NarL/FixJ family response regulator